jgi:integrase/recombinase XerD
MARPASRVSRVLMTGPLAPFADAYALELNERGYTPLTTVNELRQVGRLSRWLVASGLSAADLSGERVEQFLVWQRAGGCHRASWSRPGLVCLLEVLRPLGVLAAEQPASAGSPTDVLLACFERYLLAERGLAAGTVRGYVTHARRFLDGLGPRGGLAGLSAGEVTAAVLRKAASGVSVNATQYFVSGLRAFLRCCFIEGLVDADLSRAALPVTGRRRSSLPRGISRADAAALLGRCDRRQALGRRDYAVIITLLRLGLRAREVVGLTLDDIDWCAGELVVRGKGGREDRLPLPADVGEAIASYLRRGRPASDRREMFLRARAPYGPIASGTVSSTVRRACRRAGIAEVGAHRLRHTAACEMVSAHVPLDRPGATAPEPAEHRDLRARGSRSVAAAGGAVAGSCWTMSTLQEHVDDYLRLRRALGFKLEREERLLGQLVAHLEAAGAATLSGELAICWARQPADAQPNHWAKRLGVARKFAAYLQTIDPETEIPPADVFPARRHRPTPYLWSQSEIRRLLEGAPGRCARRCAPRPMRRCSGCSPSPACGSARRSRWSATTSTWAPA